MEEGQQPTVIQPGSQGNWQYTPEGSVPERAETTETPSSGQHEQVTWTASEYIAHQKGISWFIGLGLSIFVAALLTFFVTKDKVPAVVIVIVGIAFGIFGARQPDVLSYTVDRTGIYIGQRFHPYSVFKSFSVIDEGPIRSIVLMPLKRFMPQLSIYFDPNDEDKILDVLSSYLPYQEPKNDPVDQLMRKIRF